MADSCIRLHHVGRHVRSGQLVRMFYFSSQFLHISKCQVCLEELRGAKRSWGAFCCPSLNWQELALEAVDGGFSPGEPTPSDCRICPLSGWIASVYVEPEYPCNLAVSGTASSAALSTGRQCRHVRSSQLEHMFYYPPIPLCAHDPI